MGPATAQSRAPGAEDLSAFERKRDDPGLYRQRMGPMAPEIEVRIEGDWLHWEHAQGQGAARLAHVSAVRLSFDPSRLFAARHVIDLAFSTGGRLRLTSTSYRGLARWEAQDAAFRRFVITLHAQLARLAPGANYRRGRGWLGYGLTMAVWGIGLAAIAGAGGWLALHGEWALAAILAGMAVLFGHTAAQVALKNAPRGYDPAKLPADALPPPARAESAGT